MALLRAAALVTMMAIAALADVPAQGSSMLEALPRRAYRRREDPATATATAAGGDKVKELQDLAAAQGEAAATEKTNQGSSDVAQKTAIDLAENSRMKMAAAAEAKVMHDVDSEAYKRASQLAAEAAKLTEKANTAKSARDAALTEFQQTESDEAGERDEANRLEKLEKEADVKAKANKIIMENAKTVQQVAEAKEKEAAANLEAVQDHKFQLERALTRADEKLKVADDAAAAASTESLDATAAQGKAQTDFEAASKKTLFDADAYKTAVANSAEADEFAKETDRLRALARGEYVAKTEAAHIRTQESTVATSEADAEKLHAERLTGVADGLKAKVGTHTPPPVGAVGLEGALPAAPDAVVPE